MTQLGNIMSAGPVELLAAQVAGGLILDDPGQRRAAARLQALHAQLAAQKRAPGGLLNWARTWLGIAAAPAATGLYIHGGVGRGKSMLMDLFFDTAPASPKRRVHFHAFMQEVHGAIFAARKRGVEDPVAPVAEGIAASARLLCFDELEIGDITDAMLVGRLFEALFAAGVVIVATSNRHPDELYTEGLNRHLFLPFIALIRERLDIVSLDGPTDHRQVVEGERDVYHTPLGPTSTAALDAAWARLAKGPGAPLSLALKGRELVLRKVADRVARASFDELCRQPLGAPDYLALAAAIDVLILDDIPILSRSRNNEAKRFKILIDALYEADVRLIASAAAAPDALYAEGEGAFEFARTASRLIEMQGANWGVKRR